MVVGTDILTVLATLLCAAAFASLVASWAGRVRPRLAPVALLAGVGVLILVHLRTPGGLAWTDIPDSFILVAARILN
ncbi:hypothetical protein [Roseicyclus sp.]|uniref:hypothetical protein n=1 Tax=Roseicyclus sp. TaxID=1914329 RepID=UPI003FA13A28